MKFDDKSVNSFRKILKEETSWPHSYMFKFIIPATETKIKQVKNIFPAQAEITQRLSRTGKYTSITVHLVTRSADEVISYYRKVAEVEGVFAL